MFFLHFLLLSNLQSNYSIYDEDYLSICNNNINESVIINEDIELEYNIYDIFNMYDYALDTLNLINLLFMKIKKK